jgi:hypothetical protein
MKPAKPEPAPRKLNNIISETMDNTTSSNLVIKTATKDLGTITKTSQSPHNDRIEVEVCTQPYNS